MRVIARKTLASFWEKHSDAEQPLRAWFAVARRAIWRSPNSIKVEFPSASIVANNRVVFNVKGNSYRLVVAIKYELRLVYIRFVGTHAEYDDIDVETV